MKLNIFNFGTPRKESFCRINDEYERILYYSSNNYRDNDGIDKYGWTEVDLQKLFDTIRIEQIETVCIVNSEKDIYESISDFTRRIIRDEPVLDALMQNEIWSSQ